MDSDSDLVREALGQMVILGEAPTPQEMELGEAVKRHVANRPAPQIPIDPMPRAELVRALLDARNSIDAALAYLNRPNS